MKKNIRFTESGLRSLALVVLSCYPVHHELNVQAMTYLKEVIAGKREFDCGLLLKKIPALESSLIEFAKQGCHEKITASAVSEFFAGKVHYEKILLDFEQHKLHIRPNSVYSLRTIFAHLVLPVEIVGHESDGFIGKYSKGQHEFAVRGLVASNDDALKLDDFLLKKANPVVLIHFAAIIEVKPLREIVAQIMELNQQSELFILACKYLQKNGGVDYNVFPRDCRRETEKILKNIVL